MFFKSVLKKFSVKMKVIVTSGPLELISQQPGTSARQALVTTTQTAISEPTEVASLFFVKDEEP